MTARERVQRLLDEIPEPELKIAEKLLRPLRDRAAANGRDTEDSTANGASPESPTDTETFLTVGEIIDRINSRLTAELIEGLPTEMGSNLDHYIYGLSKESGSSE